ncbi:hypothetical protein KR222_003161, partial [Zaprionus bogoriensis]
KMDGKYKLSEANLSISLDLEFIDKVLESFGARADAEARRYLLDLSYTMARNQLVEARRFADLTNKTFVDVDDMRIANIEKTDDFQYGPLQLVKPIVQNLTAPTATTSLLLPPWRSCQVGANAELKQVLAEAEAYKTPEAAEPPPAKVQRINQRCPKST